MATSDSTPSLTATSHFLPTFTTPSIFMHGHFRFHTHFDCHFPFLTHFDHHFPFSPTSTSDSTPTFTTIFNFHTWPLQIPHPLSLPLSIFMHGPFRFCTQFDCHFPFHAWPL